MKGTRISKNKQVYLGISTLETNLLAMDEIWYD